MATCRKGHRNRPTVWTFEISHVFIGRAVICNMLAKSSLLSGRKLRRPRKPERCAIEFAYSAPKSHEHAAVEGENVYAVVISMHKNNVSILEFGDNIGIGVSPRFPV